MQTVYVWRVEPTSAKEVSHILQVLVDNWCKFAVKCSGHSRFSDNSVSVGGVKSDPGSLETNYRGYLHRQKFLPWVDPYCSRSGITICVFLFGHSSLYSPIFRDGLSVAKKGGYQEVTHSRDGSSMRPGVACPFFYYSSALIYLSLVEVKSSSHMRQVQDVLPKH